MDQERGLGFRLPFWRKGGIVSPKIDLDYVRARDVLIFQTHFFKEIIKVVCIVMSKLCGGL